MDRHLECGPGNRVFIRAGAKIVKEKTGRDEAGMRRGGRLPRSCEPHSYHLKVDKDLPHRMAGKW